MPEGFKSIADLQVVIDANTEKLTGSMELAHNLVKRFAGEGSTALTKFDSAVAVTGAGLKTMLGPIGALITAVQTVTTLWDKYGETVTEKLGADEETSKIASSAKGLGAAVTGLIENYKDLGATRKKNADEDEGDAEELIARNTKEVSSINEITSAQQGRASAAKEAKAASAQASDVSGDSPASAKKFADEIGTIRRQQANQIVDTVSWQAAEEARIRKLTNDDQKAMLYDFTAVARVASAMQQEAAGEAYQHTSDMSEGAADQAMASAEKSLTAWQKVAKQVSDTFDVMNSVITSLYKDDGKKNLIELQNDIKKAEWDVKSLNAAVLAHAEDVTRMASVSKAYMHLFGESIEEEGVKRLEKLGSAMLMHQERMNLWMWALSDKSLGDWNTTVVDDLVTKIDRATAATQRRMAAVGLDGAALEGFNEREKWLSQAIESGTQHTELQTGAIDRLVAARMRLANANQDAAQDQQIEEEGIRDARQADRIMENLDTELRAIQRKTNALGQNAAEAARLATIEKGLSEFRRLGREATDEERIAIEAHAFEVGKATLMYTQAAAQMKYLQDVGAVATRGLESAFQKFTSGAKVDFSEMVRSMLSDLAMLTFKQGVTQPLAQLLTGGGGQGGGSLLGSLFGGFRAEGGPVDPSQAYIVGERGPELFMPSAAGNVVPNHALGGGAVTIHMPLTIDARGAYPESISEIKQSVASLHASIPGRALEAVREASQRGL